MEGGLRDANAEIATKYLEKTISELEDMGITPVIFSTTPQTTENIGECLTRAEFYQSNMDECNFSRGNLKNKHVFEFLKNIAKQHKVVFLDDYLCQDGYCRSHLEETYIYRDSGHLSHEGSALLGKNMNFYSFIVGGCTEAEFASE